MAGITKEYLDFIVDDFNYPEERYDENNKEFLEEKFGSDVPADYERVGNILDNVIRERTLNEVIVTDLCHFKRILKDWYIYSSFPDEKRSTILQFIKSLEKLLKAYK